jgi:two-component system nitrate/nitrite response regulator NarL
MKVLLVDDHPVVLAGLRSFLRDAPDLELIGAVATTDEVTTRAEVLRPDVLVITMSYTAPNPLGTVALLRARFPEVAIIVLSLSPGTLTHRQLTDAGVNVVLAEDSGRDALLAALSSLRGDETGPRRLGFSGDAPPPSSGPSSLSRRELQVLTLIAEGYTNKQIADELGISVRTVETHRERLMRKLDVQGTAALTKAAITLGLVTTKG